MERGAAAPGGGPRWGDFRRPRSSTPRRRRPRSRPTSASWCSSCWSPWPTTAKASRRRLVDAYGDREGHWCAGRTPDALLHLLAKSLGQGAASPPSWDRIADIVDAAVPAARQAVVLGQAAALSARIAGEERPVRAYDGPFSAPPWIEEPVVTVAMIRAGLDTRVETAKGAGELEELRTALAAERAANRKFRSENQRLRSLLEHLLRERSPGASADTVRQQIDERLDAVVTPEPPSPRPWHG